CYGIEFSPFNGGWYLCSGSQDNTIRFWDIRSNKSELYIIKGDDKEDDGVICLKFIELKKKDNTNNVTYDLNLCYGSAEGPIHIWSNKKRNCFLFEKFY
ncbi:hypothetical protein RFI_37739, partial [Reticulomyxa filosa]